MSSIWIHPTAIVEEGALIGEGTKIWHHCHVRSGAVIGANCSIGKNVYIDSQVKLGTGVKIQNNVSVYNGVEIEDDVFVGPSVVFTNDLIPRAFLPWGPEKIVKTTVKQGASIGGGACLRCGVSVGEYAMVAMGAVILHDIADFELWAGNPGVKKGVVNREGLTIESV